MNSEEKVRVLKMIQEGKITPEEGMQLLEALEENPTAESTKPARAERSAPRQGGGRWFHVRVTDLDTGKVRTNVRIPLTVVSMGLRMGAKFAPEVQGLDMNVLNEFISDGSVGQIVDVTDDEDGEHVEVYIE
jgi:hypothetical protein